jgi:hypothetical protein
LSRLDSGGARQSIKNFIDLEISGAAPKNGMSKEFFSGEVVSLSVVENGVKLLIFDPEAEEVVQWKS